MTALSSEHRLNITDKGLALFERQALGVHDLPQQRRRKRRPLIGVVVQADTENFLDRADRAARPGAPVLPVVNSLAVDAEGSRKFLL